VNLDDVAAPDRGVAAQPEPLPSVQTSRIPVPGGWFEIRHRGPEPSWLRPYVCGIAQLLELPAGWDSYGAARIDPNAGARLLNLLGEIMRPGTPLPRLVPDAGAGLQIEWAQQGLELELAVDPNGSVEAFFAEPDAGIEWEGPYPDCRIVVAAAIDRLSQPR
jgi:hypothetical protein